MLSNGGFVRFNLMLSCFNVANWNWTEFKFHFNKESTIKSHGLQTSVV